MGVGGQRHAPDVLPRNDQVPGVKIYLKELDGRVWIGLSYLIIGRSGALL